MNTKGQFLPGIERITDVEFDTDVEEPKTDAEKKTDAIADALSSDHNAFLNVSRQTMGGNSPMEFVGRFPADKFDFGQLQAHLQQNYGGGDYRCMLYANGKVKANKLLSIAIQRNTGTDKNPTGEAAGILDTVLNRMEQMQNQMLGLMQQNSRPQQSEDDFLNRMTMYKSLFDNSGGGTQQSMFTQMKQFMELQQMMGGKMLPAPEDSGFADLIEKATPLFTAAMSGSNEPEKKPQVTPQQKAAKKMNLILKMGIGQLVNAAKKNSHPESYAEMILDNFPPAAVQKYITAPDAISGLTKINPNVANFQPWFIMLGEHVKAQLGMASTVSNLYDEPEGELKEADDGAIVTENLSETGPNNDGDVSATPDS